MSRDELLTKLAMELAEWPKNIGAMNKAVQVYGWRPVVDNHDVYLLDSSDKYQICGEHWSDRRDELINEPDDSEAPTWAKWKAQDKDGQWHWHEIKPSGVDSNLWMIEGDGFCEPASEGVRPAGHDWRATLTAVYQSACTAEEDAAWVEKDAQLNGVQAWGGPDDGLPPIHSIAEIAESSEYMKIDAPAGTQVKIYSHFTDDRGVKLAAYVCPHGRVGGVAVAQAFRPSRTPEERAIDEMKAAWDEGCVKDGKGESMAALGMRAVYAAIRDGKIPGVVLGGGHE